jgi:phosphate transport system protein
MTHFDASIESLNEKLLLMASRAETAVTRAMKALVDRDEDLARSVAVDDDLIDQLEKDVDEQAVVLLSRAPLASQLRSILVAIKIAGDLERVGDEATTIARRACDLNAEPPIRPYGDLVRMSTLAASMLGASLKAFTERDPAQARTIIPRDREVDQLNKQMVRELLDQIARAPGRAPGCLNLITISKSLERVADHAKNIAEDIVYLYEGRDIRHAGGSKPAA